MRRRQITIEGGRYLIFYSFEDEPGPDAAPSTDRPAGGVARAEAGHAAGDAPARASAVEPSAEDERRV